MKYESFKYIYPPRPENQIPAGDLYKFDNGEFIAQCKYNGSCCQVFTNGTELHVYNRHGQMLSKYSEDIEFRALAKSDRWYVFSGEYLNKGKLGEYGEKEKDKFVIWDVLVWDGEYMAGKSLLDRLNQLEQTFPSYRGQVDADGVLEMYKHLCLTDHRGIYKAPTYLSGFTSLYNDIVKTDMYEGLVLKKIASKLAFGFQSANNKDWQLKCRKPTKIYNF